MTIRHGVHDRRTFLAAATAAAGAVAAVARGDERDWTGQTPVRYPDPDIVVARQAVRPIQARQHADPAAPHRHACGPRARPGARSAAICSGATSPTTVQLRRLDDDGHVSVFRNPAGNSNGNTFDFEGRQIACEHGNRRVVRYEHNGRSHRPGRQVEGKPLNAPNDAVVHPDGGIWFTDPGYGSLMNYEGNKGALQIKEAVYRIDPKAAKIELVTDDLYKPNGLCFSPDYKKLYVADTGGPAPQGTSRSTTWWTA